MLNQYQARLFQKEKAVKLFFFVWNSQGDIIIPAQTIASTLLNVAKQ
jgi:hypothetical protein